MPANGDDIVFSGSNRKSNSNDLTNLSVKTITFSNSGWTLDGNAITLGSGSGSTVLTASTSGSNTVNFNITLGTGGTRTFSVASNGTLSVTGTINNSGVLLATAGAGAYSFSGVISGSGGFTAGGSGTLTVAASNTYSGTTTVSGGVLKLAVDDAIGDSSPVVVNSNRTLDMAGRSDTFASLAGAGNVTLGSGTLTVGAANSSTSYTGVISGSGGSVTKIGTGTWTIGGANSYTGPTTISAGQLKLNTSNRLPSSTALTIASGAALDMGTNASETVGSLSGAGNVLMGSGNLTVGGSNTSTTYSGVIGNGTGGLTKTGTGTLTLTGANSFSGTVTISGGAIKAGASNVISASKLLSLASGTTFDANSFAQTVGSLTGQGAIALGSAALTIGANNSATNSYAGVISGTGSVTKVGIHAQTFTANNTYSGGTTINNGTLIVSNTAGSGTGTGTVTVNGPGQLQGTGTVSGNVVANSGGIVAPHPGRTIFRTGAANFSNGGELVIEVRNINTPGTDYDRLDLGSNTLTLGGTSTITLNLNGLASPGAVVGIATYGSVSGQFNSVKIINNPHNFVPVLIYNACPSGQSRS